MRMRIFLDRIGNGWLVETATEEGQVDRFFSVDPQDGFRRALDALQKHDADPAPSAQVRIRYPQYKGSAKSGDEHWSDCAVNRAPAYEPGPCDCGGFKAYDI